MNSEIMPKCALETTLMLLSDKRKFLILKELETSARRFGELEKGIACASPKSLTKSLREMEKDDLIHRVVFAEVPPRVEYSLTETGEILLPVLKAMKESGNAYKKLVEKTCLQSTVEAIPAE